MCIRRFVVLVVSKTFLYFITISTVRRNWATSENFLIQSWLWWIIFFEMLYLQLFLFSSDHDTTFSLDFIICLIMVLFGFFFQLYWLTHQRVLIIIYCRWVYIFLPRNKIIIISIGIWLFNRRHSNNNIIYFKCPSWRFLFVCQIQKWIIYQQLEYIFLIMYQHIKVLFVPSIYLWLKLCATMKLAIENISISNNKTKLILILSA